MIGSYIVCRLHSKTGFGAARSSSWERSRIRRRSGRKCVVMQGATLMRIHVEVNKFSCGFYGMCNSILERSINPLTDDQLYPWRVLRGDPPAFSSPASSCSIRSPPRGSPFFPARKPSGCARWGQAD